MGVERFNSSFALLPVARQPQVLVDFLLPPLRKAADNLRGAQIEAPIEPVPQDPRFSPFVESLNPQFDNCQTAKEQDEAKSKSRVEGCRYNVNVARRLRCEP